MAAIAAAKAGARVRILEGNPLKRLGAKILVSGGSRCNVTNEHVVPARFHGEGAAPFVSRILRSFSPADTHRFFESIGVELKLEPTGKFFPVSDSSRTVLNALLRAVDESGATLSTESPVLELSFVDERWHLKLPAETVIARAVLIATGGLALPKSGSDGRGYALVGKFGHTLVETTPALTPLLSQTAPHAGMSGLTLPVRLRLFREAEAKSHLQLASYEGSFLFTHVGYSGPVALNMSRHLARVQPTFPHASVFASWLPEVGVDEEGAWWQNFQRSNSRRNVANSLAAILPNRLAETVSTRSGAGAHLVGSLNRAQIAEVKRELFTAHLPVSSVAPYDKAETTAGGVALKEIEPATMMSRLRPGLFFAGEVCDVDGWLGGYNFQWCWSSGVVAGRAAAKWCRRGVASAV